MQRYINLYTIQAAYFGALFPCEVCREIVWPSMNVGVIYLDCQWASTNPRIINLDLTAYDIWKL